MKYISCILILLLATVSVGQDLTVPGFSPEQAEAATPITIVGPDKAKSGDTVTLRLAGTPAVDLSKPLVDQLDWLMGDQRLFVYVQMPGKPMVPLDVEGTIVFSITGATMRPQVQFGVADPGEYRLVVDWNYGQNQLVEHIVAVEGDQPNPQPGPDPQPGPIPSGTRLALILHESSEISPQQAAVAEALRRHLASKPVCLYRLLDKDTPAQGQWTAPYLEQIQAKGLSLPVLAVSVLADSTNNLASPYFVSVDPLPATAEQAIAKVEEAMQ